MKNLLIYQTSEYDCGPVSLLNALRYLYEREELLPDMIKHIIQFSLDNCNEHGDIGRHGTSSSSIRFIGSWLNRYSKVRNFPIHCEYLECESVHFEKDNPLYQALADGAAIVLHIYQEVPHYVLLTGVEEDRVWMFDPFYEEEDDPDLDEEFSEEGIEMLFDPKYAKKANRRITFERMNRLTCNYYEMGPYEMRHALIIKRTDIDQ